MLPLLVGFVALLAVIPASLIEGEPTLAGAFFLAASAMGFGLFDKKNGIILHVTAVLAGVGAGWCLLNGLARS